MEIIKTEPTKMYALYWSVINGLQVGVNAMQCKPILNILYTYRALRLRLYSLRILL